MMLATEIFGGVGVVGAGWVMWQAGKGAKANGPGLANRPHVRKHAGRRRLVKQAAILRPAVVKPKAAQVGHRLGSSRGVNVWSSIEDSTVIVGPPRSGKGLHLVIPRILDHDGPVIATATRPDSLAVTMAARARRGPVMVFDPQKLAPDPDHQEET